MAFFKKYRLLISIFVFSIFTVWGLGYPLEDGYFLAMVCFWYALFHCSKRLFNIIFTLNLFICTLFTPIGLIYGRINIGLVASALETNTNESLEFLSALPWYSWLSAVIVFLSGLSVLWAARKQANLASPAANPQRSWCVRHRILILFSLSTLLVLHKPITKTFRHHRPFNLNNTLVSNVHFYIKTWQLVQQHQHETNLAKSFLSDKPVWDIQKVAPQYQNYVLVIGESVRADYLPLYNFPINTSPYLQQHAGLILDQFITPAPNTQASLTRMLHLTSDDQIIYPNSIISLANAAGFKTHWLSTQPTGHDADTAASRVGIQAEVAKFYEPNAPRSRIGTFNDTVLLDGFKELLSKQKPTTQPNLYVFHINGSHPRFCKRLIQPVSEQFKNQEMSCYLETLKQTDQLIENIVQTLQAHGSYSLIYLADHGLAHINKNTADVTLTHATKYKQAYHAPFIRISSDDQQQTRQYATRSGLQFINGFAEWLGIEEPKLKLPYPFFSEQPATETPKVFDWETVIPYESLEDDPALTP